MKNIKLIMVLLFFITATSLTAQVVKKSTTETTNTTEEKTIRRHKKAPSREKVKLANDHHKIDSKNDRIFKKKKAIKIHKRRPSNGNGVIVDSRAKSPRHGRNSIYHHRRGASKGSPFSVKSIVILDDAEFDKLYGKPTNNLKIHETARSRNQTAQEEELEEIETLKSPRHGRNSIYHHRRRASKGSPFGVNSLVVLDDAEFDKLYGVNSVDRHKKKPSIRLQYLKYRHKRNMSKIEKYELEGHLKKESSLELQKVDKHKRRPSKNGEWEEKTKF
ncbi:hypothetical protein [Tenacibaculum sp. 1_MG-2023]|uniref:hypothetical protein n=1 Tax=Tenacibaculum sp. 1_MG-2023 TaxID=3062653 RepID=UPI0026E22C87|nr:hypothetical protein [Tenacibaculum sp. 1_MG-2023]MDO6600227.1 hypothetical protein [Tenacibaculum sp. 1_MG-2023]